MDLESREKKIEAVLANLGEQDVGEDWIEKIRSDANAMLERDPVVAYVRDQAGLALRAMRQRRIDAAKPPTNGIDELLRRPRPSSLDGTHP